MTAVNNPFPIYPVRRLDDEPDSVIGNTHKTDAIVQSRKYVQDYVTQWLEKGRNPPERAPIIVAVQGEFGSGKTHLLLDATVQVQQALSDAYPGITVLRSSCVQTSPEDWFRRTIGPALKPKSQGRHFMRDVVVRLYARAGESIARRANMTAQAVEELQEDPETIYDYIKRYVLNDTAVDQEFQSLLHRVCPKIDEDVLRALSELVWEPTADVATRWLAGESLSLVEAKTLQVEASDFTESNARDVLIALAAIHDYLNIPFGLMIDELEHFVRYDENNLTWLKRLLERLGGYRTLVYIAGYWTAWEMIRQDSKDDFLGRFSYGRTIVLTELTVDDVLDIVRSRVRDLSPRNFDRPQAEAIVEFTFPNSTRYILSLCKTLFDESEGFQTALSREDIQQLALRNQQQVPIEEVELRVREFFEDLGLAVQKDAVITENIRFDLVASQEQPRVAVEFEYSITQVEQIRAAQRFSEQMNDVRYQFPDLIGCFISGGNVDKEMLSTLRSVEGANILTFDFNDPNFRSKFAQELTSSLRSTPPTTDPKQREQSHRVVRGMLAALEQEREAEVEEQRAWQDEYAKSLSSARRAQVVASPYEREEMAARLHNTYAELSRRVDLSTRLRLSLGTRAYTISGLLVLGLLNLVVPGAFLRIYAHYISDTMSAAITFISYVGAGCCLLLATVISVRLLAALDTYLDFHERVLRDLYIRTSSAQDLVNAHHILRDALEDHGPVYGRSIARERLAQAMPEYFDVVYGETKTW